MKRSLDGLRGLPLGVLVERLGGEALRFRDERRLAGLVKLEGEDADGGDGEGRCHGREGNALALAGSLALAEIVVAAAGDGGDDAQQFGLALGLSLRTQIGGEGLGRHFPQNAAGVGYQARLQNGRNAFLGTACGQHANDALAPWSCSNISISRRTQGLSCVSGEQMTISAREAANASRMLSGSECEAASSSSSRKHLPSLGGRKAWCACATCRGSRYSSIARCTSQATSASRGKCR